MQSLKAMSSVSHSKVVTTSVLSRLQTAAINGRFAKAAQRAFELEDDDPGLQQLSDALAAADWHVLPAIELLDGQTMAGLRGAYTASDPHGQQSIYLNAAWLQRADANAIESVLLEEIGHALDHRLQQGQDSPGDEGAVFAAYLHNRSISESTFQENDHQFLDINGQKIAIEAATQTP